MFHKLFNINLVSGCFINFHIHSKFLGQDRLPGSLTFRSQINVYRAISLKVYSVNRSIRCFYAFEMLDVLDS